MAKVYKNFMIVRRDEKNKQVVSYIQNTYKIWFDDHKDIWHVKSPSDCVLIYFDVQLSSSQDIILANNSIKFPNKRDGCILLHVQGANVKVSKCKYSTSSIGRSMIKKFKEYLVKTIKNIPNYDKGKFTLYWKDSLYNYDLQNIIRDANFITNKNKKIYTFSKKDYEEKKDVYGLDSVFGSKSTDLFGNSDYTTVSNPFSGEWCGTTSQQPVGNVFQTSFPSSFTSTPSNSWFSTNNNGWGK